MPPRFEPILEALCARSARLLRPFHVPLPGARSIRHCGRVALIFDAGTLTVTPSEDARELAVKWIPGEIQEPDDGLPMDEEDPWWKVLGNPLCRAWALSDPDTDARAIELQLRPDDANPKRLRLALDGAGVRVSEASPGR